MINKQERVGPTQHEHEGAKHPEEGAKHPEDSSDYLYENFGIRESRRGCDVSKAISNRKIGGAKKRIPFGDFASNAQHTKKVRGSLDSPHPEPEHAHDACVLHEKAVFLPATTCAFPIGPRVSVADRYERTHEVNRHHLGVQTFSCNPSPEFFSQVFLDLDP